MLLPFEKYSVDRGLSRHETSEDLVQESASGQPLIGMTETRHDRTCLYRRLRWHRGRTPTQSALLGLGSGDEWQEHIDDVFDVLTKRWESSGAGVADDPDPFEDYLCFYVDGSNVAALIEAVRPVLEEYGCSIAPSDF